MRTEKRSRWQSRSSRNWDCAKSSLPSMAAKATGKVTYNQNNRQTQIEDWVGKANGTQHGHDLGHGTSCAGRWDMECAEHGRTGAIRCDPRAQHADRVR